MRKARQLRRDLRRGSITSRVLALVNGGRADDVFTVVDICRYLPDVERRTVYTAVRRLVARKALEVRRSHGPRGGFGVTQVRSVFDATSKAMMARMVEEIAAAEDAKFFKLMSRHMPKIQPIESSWKWISLGDV